MKLPLASLGQYRLIAGDEPARMVARKLFNDPVPYVLVRNAQVQGASWYVFETDDWLFEHLQGVGSVETCLELLKRPRNTVLKLERLLRQTLGLTSKGTPETGRIIVDSRGMVQSVVGEQPLLENEAVIYPLLTTEAKWVDRDEVVEFAIELRANEPDGVATALDLKFQAGEETIPVHAEVSTESFSMPAGTTWQTDIKVARDLTTTPRVWNFKARALGDRERYSLLVRFFAREQQVGSIVATLTRTGASALPTAVSSSGPFAPFPDASHAALSLVISEQGATIRRMTMRRRGVHVASAPWEMSADGGYFAELQGAKTRDRIREIGDTLWSDLPDEIQDALEKDPEADLPLVITGGAPYAPFEVTRVPIGLGEALGVRRPVLRWIGGTSPPVGKAPMGEFLCIRPEYGANELRSAAEEEAYLSDRLPLHLARTEETLRPFLDNPAIQAIHFAGHAQTNPPLLKLQAGGQVRPAFFNRTSRLMKEGHPFLFLNGCHAGTGRVATPSGQGNMVKLFLSFGARGVVAPAIEVLSSGALAVAREFYAAIQEKKSIAIGQVMQRIRAKAFSDTTAPEHAGTYLSYLAFASPSLALTWPA